MRKEPTKTELLEAVIDLLFIAENLRTIALIKNIKRLFYQM